MTFKNIVKSISDFDIYTTIPQNVIFLFSIIFVCFIKSNYQLKLKVIYFLLIITLFYFILSILRYIYNIQTEFTVSSQFLSFALCCILYFCTLHDYKVSKSFRKGLVYGAKLPDGLLYYNQRNQLNTQIEFKEDIFIISFFEVFDDNYKTQDVLCLLKKRNKKTNCKEIMLASFEEVLAMFDKVQYKNIQLYNYWLKELELLAEKNNKDKFYMKVIDKINLYKNKMRIELEKDILQ